MSGHSKFANIKHKKEKNDAARGKVFTILGREIAVAVKEGGPDPANNSRLRDVIAKAKASGTAIIVKALTDNKNRTASNVRNAFTKGSGSVGTQGCVSYMFDEKGQIILSKEELEDADITLSADDLMMIALDAGAEDFSEEEDSFEIITLPEDFSAVREAIEAEKIPMASAEVTMLPQTYVTLTDENDIKQLQRTLDLLDEDDDVQDVYHNWDE